MFCHDDALLFFPARSGAISSATFAARGKGYAAKGSWTGPARAVTVDMKTGFYGHKSGATSVERSRGGE